MVNVLEFKEKLSYLRKQLIRNSKSLLQITVNIPGSNKLIYPAIQLFDLSIKQVIDYFKLDINSIKYINYTNPMLLCIIVCDVYPITLKSELLELEDLNSLGKYWDFDVFAPNLSKISRADLNYPQRKCFLCGLPAKVCSANQTHPIINLIEDMVNAYNKYNAKSESRCV